MVNRRAENRMRTIAALFDAAKNHDANADSTWTAGWWSGKPNDDAYQETIRMAANRAARNGYAYPGDTFFMERMATSRPMWKLR